MHTGQACVPSYFPCKYASDVEEQSQASHRPVVPTSTFAFLFFLLVNTGETRRTSATSPSRCARTSRSSTSKTSIRHSRSFYPRRTRTRRTPREKPPDGLATRSDCERRPICLETP